MAPCASHAPCHAPCVLLCSSATCTHTRAHTRTHTHTHSPPPQTHLTPTTRLDLQGSLELTDYLLRLGGIFAFFTAAVGGPISFQTFSPMAQPVEWILSATVGSLVVVALVVVRIFLGWSYVSERLLSAAYPYEETGWCVSGMHHTPYSRAPYGV
jgi:hypothetical protein